MIDKLKLQALVNEYLAKQEQHYELIELTISAENDIRVVVDSLQPMDLDFCAALSRAIEAGLDRDAEDYSLEVGSAGLTDPLKTPMQYQKHLGDDVEILTKAGEKLHGQLVDSDAEGFLVDMQIKVQEEGKKRKVTKTVSRRFEYNEVKHVVYDLKV